GLMMASDCSMESTQEECTSDVSPGHHTAEPAFADRREEVDILVDHHVGRLVGAQVHGDAEHGPGHEIPDPDPGRARGCGGIGLAAARELRDDGPHDVALGGDAEEDRKSVV